VARIDGVSIGLILAGTVSLYTGAKGYSIPQTVQDLITGKPPAGQTVTSGITGTAATASGPVTGGSASGDAIAQDALSYVGKLGYSWGGSLASGKPDCSGFANGVIGGDEGMAIPGYAAGTFSRSNHGPSSFIWAAWSGCTTIGNNPAQAVPGDLCIFMNPTGHIGIATGGGRMVSDLDPAQGVQETQIAGTAGGVLIIRRLKAVTAISNRMVA